MATKRKKNESSTVQNNTTTNTNNSNNNNNDNNVNMLKKKSLSKRGFSINFDEGEHLVGKNIEIFWEGTDDGDQWFPASIEEYNPRDRTHLILYDDGDEEWYDLQNINFRFAKRAAKKQNDENTYGKHKNLVKTFSSIGMAGAALLGQRLEIYWVDENDSTKGTWYPAMVKEYKLTDKKHLVVFDDGDEEWYDLDSIQYRVLGTHHHTGHISTAKHLEKAEDELRYEDFDIQPEKLIGRHVEIFWHDDEVGNNPNAGQWFLGIIDDYDETKKEHHVTYEDNDSHWYPFDHIRYRAIDVKDLNKLSDATTPRSHHPDTMPSPRTGGSSLNLISARKPPSRKSDKSSLLDDVSLDDVVDVNLDNENENLIGLENIDGPRSPQSGINRNLAKMGSVFNMEVPDPELPMQREKIQKFLNSVRTGKMDAGEKDASWYLQDFDIKTADKEIIIGSISMEDIELQERKMENDRLISLQKEAARYRRREEHISVMEDAAKLRVIKRYNSLNTKLEIQEKKSWKKIRKQQEKLRREFKRKEAKLIENLKQQQAYVSKKFGTLEERRDYLQLSLDSYNVNWKHTPQPIQLHVHMARAVRDRLPNGRYILLLTLYNRLGGQPLHWTELGLSGAGVGLPGATEPVRHNGRYYDTEFVVEEDIFVVCPAQRDVQPTLTYVLELYQLGGERWPDRVMAWTAFPAVDMHKNLISGRFKLPLIRGIMDTSVDTYSGLESSYATDLDRWLSNVYVEVVKLPKEAILEDGSLLMDRMIEMDFTRNLLSLHHDMSSYTNYEDTLYLEVEEEEKQQEVLDQDVLTRSKSSRTSNSALRNRKHHHKNHHAETQKTLIRKKSLKINVATLDKFSYSLRRRGDKNVGHTNLGETARRFAFMGNEFAAEFNVRRCGSLDFWVSMFILLVAFYTRLFTHYIGQYVYLKIAGVHVYRFTPTPYTVITKYTAGPLPVHVELGTVISGQMFNIIIFLWIMTIAWAWKKILGRFPDVGSQFALGFGLGTVFDGVICVIIDLLIGNYNCLNVSVCTADITDIECTCMTGDAFKLGERFLAVEGTSVPGMLLTVIVYLLLFTLASILYYNYLLTLHFNGRVWDLYRRLSLYDGSFFVPDDLEISAGELRWICSKSARWRGPRGDRRKCAVVEYVLTDPLAPKFKEITTHLAIYHVTPSDERTLYRHFLRLPDGTILEVFGDIMDSIKGQYSTLENILIEAGQSSGSTHVDDFLKTLQ